MTYEEKLDKILKMDMEADYKDFVEAFKQWNGKPATSWSMQDTIEFNHLVVDELARLHAVIEVLVLELKERNKV